MKVELKSIEHSDKLSHETLAFFGKVFVNGKYIAHAENDGRGGSTDVYPVGTTWDEEGNATYDKTNKETLNKLREWADEKFTYGLEQLIDDLVLEELYWRDFQKLKRRKLLYYQSNKVRGEIRSAGSYRPEYIEQVQKTSWWKPEYVVLNKVKRNDFIENYLGAFL